MRSSPTELHVQLCATFCERLTQEPARHQIPLHPGAHLFVFSTIYSARFLFCVSDSPRTLDSPESADASAEDNHGVNNHAALHLLQRLFECEARVQRGTVQHASRSDQPDRAVSDALTRWHVHAACGNSHIIWATNYCEPSPHNVVLLQGRTTKGFPLAEYLRRVLEQFQAKEERCCASATSLICTRMCTSWHFGPGVGQGRNVCDTRHSTPTLTGAVHCQQTNVKTGKLTLAKTLKFL